MGISSGAWRSGRGHHERGGACPYPHRCAGGGREPESRRGPFPVPLKGWRAALAAGGGLVPRGGDFRREAPQTRRRTLAGGASEGFGRLRRDLEYPLYTNEHVYGTADTRAPPRIRKRS